MKVNLFDTNFITDSFLKAYRGVTIPNFPNFFILLGPNSRLGHSSVLIMLEAQLNYLVETLLYMNENDIQSISIKQKCT